MKISIRQIAISIASIAVILGSTQPVRAMTAEQAIEIIKAIDNSYRSIKKIFEPEPPNPQPVEPQPAPTPEPQTGNESFINNSY
jgi:hypothetical protein